MTREMFLSFETTIEKNAESFATGVCVLVVDCDFVGLTIASKMLHVSGYKVITVKRAMDALRILREGEDVDLILTEVNLPDMDKYELLEAMDQSSDLPIIIQSADSDAKAMLGGLFKGAEFYLLKPISTRDLKNLWQFSYIKKRETLAAAKVIDNFKAKLQLENLSNKEVECQSFLNKGGKSCQKDKRKRQEERDKDVEECENNDLAVTKKSKLVWTEELHNKFLQTVWLFGVDCAHPKKILQHMNVPGLKKENISSHLQKYRLSLKRNQGAIRNTMISKNHPSSKVNLQSGYIPLPSTSCQPEFRSCSQNNLISHIFMSPLGSARFPTDGVSNHNNVSFTAHEQMASQGNHMSYTHSNSCNTGTGTIGTGEMLCFDQLGDQTLLKKEIALSSMGNQGFETATYGSTFMENSSDQELYHLQKHPQQQILLPEMSSPLPLPLMPQQEQEHNIVEGERVDLDELFDMKTWSNIPIFSDVDLNDLWW